MTLDERIKSKPARGPGRPRRAAAPDTDGIVQAAVRIFAEKGFDRTAMREIAAAAGVDVALLSYLHGSKQGLWEAVVDRIAAAIIVGLEAPSVKGLGPALERLIDLLCEHPAAACFIARDMTQPGERLEYLHAALGAPIHDHVMPLIEEAFRTGLLGDPDPELFFFAFSHALTMSIATRGFIGRYTPVVIDDAMFRDQLKRTLVPKRLTIPSSTTKEADDVI